MNSSLSMGNKKAAQRRSKSKTQNNISRLFQKLRRDSGLDNTIFSTDDSQNNTVIEVDSFSQTSKKRKKSFEESTQKKSRTKCESSVIDVEAGPSGASTPRKQSVPLGCSTPIPKEGASTKELVIRNFACQMNEENTLKEDVKNLTKIINKDSFLTIDLTAESEFQQTKHQDSVINLESSLDDTECTVVSVSKANLSISGESDVTVMNMPKKKKKNMQRFANGIAQLDSSEKGKLLEFITQKIFNGCNLPSTVKESLANITESINKATETVEDTYIKEVILGKNPSRNSVGSNIYHPERDVRNKTGLRMIVIDGSNVAMEHGKGKVFSVKGLKICIDYFVRRGHVVKAFVPRFRCKFGKSSEPRLLDALERQGLVVYTPSREIQGRTVTPYDDRYIVQCAAEFEAVIVSGDNYRDLVHENPKWRFVIENRLLPFTWVEDMIMFPRDPLGRNGPTLERFLSHPTRNPIFGTQI